MAAHAKPWRRRTAGMQHGSPVRAAKHASSLARTATKRPLLFAAVVLFLSVTLPSSLAARNLRQAEAAAASEAVAGAAPAPRTVKFNLPPEVIMSDVPLEIPAETIQAAFRGSPAPVHPAPAPVPSYVPANPVPIPAPAPVPAPAHVPAPVAVPVPAPSAVPLEQHYFTIPSASGGAPVILTTGTPGAPGPSVITIPGQQQQQSLGFKSAWHPLMRAKEAPPPEIKVITPPATVPQQVAAAATPAPQAVATAAASATAIGSGGLSIVTSNPISISTPVTTFNPVKTKIKTLPNVLSIPAIDGKKMLMTAAGLLKAKASLAQGLTHG